MIKMKTNIINMVLKKIKNFYFNIKQQKQDYNKKIDDLFKF